MAGNVRFARIRGRVVPIRGGSPEAARKKPSPPRTPSRGVGSFFSAAAAKSAAKSGVAAGVSAFGTLTALKEALPAFSDTKKATSFLGKHGGKLVLAAGFAAALSKYASRITSKRRKK